MQVFPFQKKISKFIFSSINILKNLKFSIFILFLIAFISSLGSIIEQDQDQSFYELTYASKNAVYGFLNGKLILLLQLDHLYQSWYFNSLLILLVLSLTLCSFYNQWPLLKNSRKFFFNLRLKNFQNKKEFFKKQNIPFEKEDFLLKTQKLNYYLYQNQNYIYGYKALIGRISPIFVHLSLIILLLASLFSAFENLKAEEILAKGEIAHFQNLLKVGKLTSLPKINIRINDFWANYENQKIKQFYSNISLLDNAAKEKDNKTISVNQPLTYKSFNFYQSDWDFKGIRILDKIKEKSLEYPLFPLSKKEKIWISWINTKDEMQKQYIFIVDELRNTFFVYDEKGKFLKEEEINRSLFSKFQVIDFIKRTGLLIKYDPTIPVIYLSFAFLILSTFLSFLPYQRLCVFTYQANIVFFSFSSNRNIFQQNILALLFLNKGIKNY